MEDSKWIRRWRYEIAPKPSKPGVWRKRGGGFVVRGRAMDPATNKLREVVTTVESASAVAAFTWLQEELRKIREGEATAGPRQITFADYAISLLDRKLVGGEIRSAKTRIHWGTVLEHHLLPAFGNVMMDRIGRAQIIAWRTEVARRIQAGDYSPHTANGWLAVLRVIVNTFVADEQLDRNPITNVSNFDLSTHETYTDEEPNSLPPERVGDFLMVMRRMFPQHFAFVALGFATGLRPSSLRPLRRRGPESDVDLENGILRVRRSHTVRDEVMNRTKTGLRQRVALPPDLVDVLRWHVDHLPAGAMRDSDLLFPSDVGRFRSSTVLVEPFAEVSAAIGLKFHFTPRGMRRTFQDLARHARVDDIVTRRVSGHATEEMQRHYSTVQMAEVREGLGRVVSLGRFKEAMAASAANDVAEVV